MTTFFEFVQQLDLDHVRRIIADAQACDVERVLSREHLEDSDIPVLVSSAAAPYLEELAQRSAAVTERRFGKVISLFTPLYVSNECVNRCTYCGFAGHLQVPRISLSVEQAIDDARILYEEGFRHILLVSGESRHHVNVPYLTELTQKLKDWFDSISIEINTMTTEEYRDLAEVGVDGLTIFQETYDPVRYREFHPAGPKRIYDRRLKAMESGGEAGFRSLGLGALLGLTDWRFEAVMLAWHGRYLARRFWQSRIGFSFPRIREAAGGYKPNSPVTDRDLVQMICAMRLALPDADLVMSTREPASLRDRLIGLGITRMSAGSRTNPGGYSHPDAGGEQFEVVDARSPEEVARVIREKGFEPVWKDFDREFIPGPAASAH